MNGRKAKANRSIATTLPLALPDVSMRRSVDERRAERRARLPRGAPLLAAALLLAAVVAVPLSLSRPAATPPPDRAVVRAVAVGSYPSAMAVDTRTRRVFVVDGFSNSSDQVGVLDADSGALLRTVTVGAGPQSIAVDARRRRAFVVGEGVYTSSRGFTGAALSVLDTRDGRLMRAVRWSGLAVAVDAGTGHVFVTDRGAYQGLSHGRLAAGRVTMFDQDGHMLRLASVGAYPGGLAVDSSTERVFVAGVGSRPTANAPGSVSIVDARTGRLVRTVAVGPDPRAVAVDARTERVFVASEGVSVKAGSVSVLDARDGRIVATIPLAYPESLAASPRTGRVFVQTAFGAVVTLDARTGRIVNTVSVDHAMVAYPALAVDEGRRRVFVPGRLRTTVLDATTGRVTRTIAVRGEVVAVDGASGHAFVAHADLFDPQPSGLGAIFGRGSSAGHVTTLDLSR